MHDKPRNHTPQRVLIIATSHAALGDTGDTTGLWLEELAAPYWAFVDAGMEVDIASPIGGAVPYDPRSVGNEDTRTGLVERFLADQGAGAKIVASLPLDEVDLDRYDAVFLPGGHGTMWDFPDSRRLGDLVTEAFRRGLIVGAVCHGPAGLISATKGDDSPLVQGRRISAFTNEEEREVGLDKVVPFLLEDRLRDLGAHFEKGPPFEPFSVVDQNLVTGQNPQSSRLVAVNMIRALAGQIRREDEQAQVRNEAR
ncbi:MAG TPA: type 1 glutamine amidotransferase domain-containing protein [Alphaproteobacteria bacterium]|nr:type 1 glutamine amidotransferase domain-containing protein [Alphaproteobacteria bacterium]